MKRSYDGIFPEIPLESDSEHIRELVLNLYNHSALHEEERDWTIAMLQKEIPEEKRWTKRQAAGHLLDKRYGHLEGILTQLKNIEDVGIFKELRNELFKDHNINLSFTDFVEAYAKQSLKANVPEEYTNEKRAVYRSTKMTLINTLPRFDLEKENEKLSNEIYEEFGLRYQPS